MQIILNIGLDGVPSDGPGFTNGVRNPDIADKMFRCMRELRSRGFTIGRSAVLHSNTEPTLVVEVEHSGLGLDNTVYMLAQALNQEAIAVYKCSEGAGDLIGPKSSNWGAFDPQYFLVLSGRTLQQVQYAAERLMQEA